MDESIETALLDLRGRITVLSLAIGELIELAPRPDATRATIRSKVSDVLAIFDVSTDPRHMDVAEGLRSQLEELTATD